MQCPTCGVDNDANRQYCVRCNTDLRPYPAYEFAPTSDPGPWVADGQYAEPGHGYDYGWPQAPQQAPPAPTEPSESQHLLAAFAIDALLCVLLLSVGLVIATEVARTRGASGIRVITGHLDMVQALLALVVVAVYGIGALWLTGRTPGQILVNRGGVADPAVRRQAGRAIGPSLIALAVAAITVGATVPVSAAAGAGRRSPTGTADTVPGSGASATSIASGDPATANTQGRAQAVAIDSLLVSTVASRAALASALSALDACGDVNGALVAARRVTDQRVAQLDQAQRLRTDALANGEAIRNSLVESLSHSLDADRAYAAWAQNVVSVGCGRDANHDAGDAASQSAGVAKRTFVQLWNPVAVSFGLPVRTDADV
jgi:hypothetical protein